MEVPFLMCPIKAKKHRNSNKKKKEGDAPSPPAVDCRAPKLMYFPTTFTPDSDVALLDMFRVEDGPTDQPIGLTPKYTLTFSGINDIVDEVHLVLASNHQYNRNVSASMFHYYCTQLLMARVVAIRMDDGVACSAEQVYHTLMDQNQFPVPSVLDEYSRGMGSFRMMNDVEVEAMLPNYDQKHWGVIDKNTHYLYENYPHP